MKDRERQELWDERQARNGASKEWAARFAEEFAVKVTALADGSGDVAVNPEGLYALLVGVAGDAGWLLDELPVELQIRDGHADDCGGGR